MEGQPQPDIIETLMNNIREKLDDSFTDDLRKNIESQINAQRVENNNNEIVDAKFEVSESDPKTVTITLTFSQNLNTMCNTLCENLDLDNPNKGGVPSINSLDELLTNAAKAYIGAKNGSGNWENFNRLFDSFNESLNQRIAKKITVDVIPKPPQLPPGEETRLGFRQAAQAAQAAAAFRTSPLAAEPSAEAAIPEAAGEEAAAATPEAAGEEAAARQEGEAAAPEAPEALPEGQQTGGKKKLKKKGGADVGSLNEIYNARDLIVDDHPPSGVVNSPDLNMAQYSPASFSAGSLLAQDQTQGIAQPSQELLNPLSSQQVAGAKKKVLKKKKRDDSPKKKKK